MEYDNEKIKQAGSIAQHVRTYAQTYVKKGMLLREIAEHLEAKIRELGGKPAFPVNLSINEIAAHNTPSYNDTGTAQGLLKVDIGVHCDGWVADTALSLNLDNNKDHTLLITTAQQALQEALKLTSATTSLATIGKVITETAQKNNCQVITNLSGHSIEQYHLHAGMTIPNYDTGQKNMLGIGLFAIEPFTTTGLGKVRDGKPSSIYSLAKQAPVRDALAREVLTYILETYQTLPFCARWLHATFGTRALLALQRLEQAGIIYQYPQLVEVSGAPVAQAEHTLFITKKSMTITTE